MPSPQHATFKLASGREIPWLAIGNGSGKARQSFEVDTYAIEAGFRHLDTAQGYVTDDGANKEKVLGDALKKSGRPREDFYIVTKISQEKGSPDSPPVPLEQFVDSVKGSLERLGTQPDLILIHSPNIAEGGDVAKYWTALEKLKEDGTITADLGISNFFPEQIEAVHRVAKYPIALHQLEMHPLLLNANKSILDLHEKYNIRLGAYGPLSPLLRRPKEGAELKTVLERIGQRIGADANNALLLWFKAKGYVAVTTSSKKERIEALAPIDQLPALTPEEVDEIDTVGKKGHARAYDEHFVGFDDRTPNLPSGGDYPTRQGK